MKKQIDDKISFNHFLKIVKKEVRRRDGANGYPKDNDLLKSDKGMDSLDQAEIILSIEEKIGYEVPTGYISEDITIEQFARELYDYIPKDRRSN